MDIVQIDNYFKVMYFPKSKFSQIAKMFMFLYIQKKLTLFPL